MQHQDMFRELFHNFNLSTISLCCTLTLNGLSISILDEELIRYVHKVTPVQKSHTTFQLQTSSTHMRKEICFFPDKTRSVIDAIEEKSPVNIKKYDFNQQYNNIVIKKHTMAQNHYTKLNVKTTESSQGQITTVMIKNISPFN